MKRLGLVLTLLGTQSFATATLPTPESFLSINPAKLLKMVHENINGWTKLQFKNQKIWSPTNFYAEKIKDPKAWLGHVQKLGFCEPDKSWNDFPVLTVSNQSIDESFQLAVQTPHSRVFTKMSYTAMSWHKGKARSVSYDFTRGGPNVKITCSATNEKGDTINISQDIDVTQPKNFKVEQKKNGKLLKI